MYVTFFAGVKLSALLGKKVAEETVTRYHPKTGEAYSKKVRKTTYVFGLGDKAKEFSKYQDFLDWFWEAPLPFEILSCRRPCRDEPYSALRRDCVAGFEVDTDDDDYVDIARVNDASARVLATDALAAWGYDGKITTWAFAEERNWEKYPSPVSKKVDKNVFTYTASTGHVVFGNMPPETP